MNWRQDWDRQQQLESMSLAEYDRMMELDRLFQDLQQGEADAERRQGSLTAAPAFSLRDYLYQGYNRRMGPESARMMFGDGERMGYADFMPVLGGLVPGVDGAIDAATNGLSAGNAMDVGFGVLDAVGVGALARGAGRVMRGLNGPDKFSDGYTIGQPLTLREASTYEPIPGKPGGFRVPGGATPEDKASWPRFDARPINDVELIADQYMWRNGIPGSGFTRSFDPFDEDRARRVALEFDRMQHDPTNPAVRRSYDAMIEETLAQLRSIEDLGIDIRFNQNGFDPYAATPAMAYEDLVRNGRLNVFPTDDGFGTLRSIEDNPLLQRVGRVGDLQNATANDAFRVVHDVFGHFAPGNPMFRGPGEERAWAKHVQMYSPEARGAMTSETRGQNSWVNYGPHAARNATADAANTIYADQKVGLMSPWTWETQ